jgi:hypothetical protein
MEEGNEDPGNRISRTAGATVLVPRGEAAVLLRLTF